MFHFRLFLSLALSVSCSAVCAQGSGEAEFESLFNGKDLDGWVKEGAAGFVVRDEKLICNGAGNWPTWLRTQELYENFVLRLEYKGFYGAESGVFFAAPVHGLVSRTGYEIQISDNRGRDLKHSPGAIFGALAPLKEAARKYNDPEFNDLEIRFEWPRLKVTLNNEVVQDLDVREHPKLKHRPRVGYIGFQDRGKPVHFRNIRIQRLPNQVMDRWQAMLNGKDLTGWTISEKCSAAWSVEDDGALLGEKGHGYLISNDSYQDCALSFYTRSSPLANGGVFFRWLSERNRGFEIQIEDIPDSNDPTGSIYNRVRAERLPIVPGEWALMQVFLKGTTCVVRLNGVVVAESQQMPRPREGKISLQMHTGNGWVRWKDLKIRPLSDDEWLTEEADQNKED